MSTATKLALYIADDLEKLNTRVSENLSIDKLKLSTCTQISHMMESTWTEAKKAETNLDEERAYILYMRLFSSLTALRQAKDAATNQPTVQYYQKGAAIWMEKADQLSESLRDRYMEKNAVKIAEEQKIQAEIDEEKSLTSKISPQLLYKYLNRVKKTILLIDMRLKPDYDQSHMRTSACIHIPADLMAGKGWTSWGVESALTDQTARTKFQQRATFDYVVLFDDGTYEVDLTQANALSGLKQAIFSYDRDVKLKHEPLILDGGYEDWMSYYPGESNAPLIPKVSNGSLRSFEVVYPDDVVIPEPVVPEETIPLPQIDRTRKPKAESPVIEVKELPVTVEERPSTPVIIEPQPVIPIPDRSIKPDIPLVVKPIIPKPIDNQPEKKDLNGVNLPRTSLPDRQNLAIYRPFTRATPTPDPNPQYQMKFDAVTGRKVILDTKTNQYINNVPEIESNKPVPPPAPSIPTVNRDVKPLLTDQTRRQIALDYHALTGQPQAHRRTGLKNLGNSCYMNAVVQSLSYNFALTNYFLAGEFNKEINVNNKLGSRGLVVREWFRLMYALWSQQFTCVAPQPFKSVVGRLQRAYLGTQQQDAHEFLVFLLDSLHEDLNQTTRPRVEELKAENYKTDRLLAEATKQAFRLHNKSIIIDLFYGLFKSTTKCLSCSFDSIQFEAFAMISVPIPPIRQCALDDCLDLFREYEHLTGDERYECSKCKRLSEKRRRLDIWELPKIFIVHFKRFRVHQKHLIKNETLIRYPVSNIDFSRWSQTGSTGRYSLVSVVNHYGSLNSGHYTSFCTDGKHWFYCDDQSIRLADPRELERNVHAYLLFFSSIPQPNLRLPVAAN